MERIMCYNMVIKILTARIRLRIMAREPAAITSLRIMAREPAVITNLRIMVRVPVVKISPGIITRVQAVMPGKEIISRDQETAAVPEIIQRVVKHISGNHGRPSIKQQYLIRRSRSISAVIAVRQK